MSIEAHLTLSHPPQAEPALRAWLAPRTMKLTCIELSQGASPRQTMITAWREGPTDAAILDAHALPIELVRRVFAAKADPWKHGLDTQFIRAWEVEWASFALEYPELATDDRDAWVGRLASTLQLTA